MKDLLETTWRAIWLVPVIAVFFVLVLLVFVRNGRSDATYLMELL